MKKHTKVKIFRKVIDQNAACVDLEDSVNAFLLSLTDDDDKKITLESVNHSEFTLESGFRGLTVFIKYTVEMSWTKQSEVLREAAILAKVKKKM